MSVPRSATSSFSTKNWVLGEAALGGLEKLDGTAWSTTVPCGTSRI